MSSASLASVRNEEMIALPILPAFRCRWSRFEPYHGMLGCDLSSSHPFEGTLAPYNLDFFGVCTSLAKRLLSTDVEGKTGKIVLCSC